MQPPGGPPGDKRRPLPPPPWGHPKRDATAPPPPEPTPLPGTTLPGTPPPPPPAPPPPAPPSQKQSQPLPLIPPPESAPIWPGAPEESAPGERIAGFLTMTLTRAFRIQIEPSEVLPQERAALTLVEPPIIDPGLQAFLAWRRSVLFVVACTLVPLVVLRIIELATLPDPYPDGYVGLQTLPLLAEGAFLVIAWTQLARWTQWQRQRRPLVIGWLVFFLAPFAVYLYPMQRLFEGAGVSEAQLVGVGVIVSVQATLLLAPAALSLVPGVARGALVAKLWFPASAAPGWLIALATPLGAVLAYLALVAPYQITGSGWFVLGIAGIIAAQVVLGRAGLRLVAARTESEVIETVKRARPGHGIAMALGGLFAAIGFATLIDTMELPALRIVNALLSFVAGVLALTLIATDLLVDAQRETPPSSPA